MQHQTDDLRIRDIKQVAAPRRCRKKFPISEKAARTVYERPPGDPAHPPRRGQTAYWWWWALLRPRSSGGHGVCRAPLRPARRAQAGSDDRDAGLFREAAHHGGLEGADQRPDLDGSFEINKGLRLARKLLLDLAEMGMPAGTEFLDLISPQYSPTSSAGAPSAPAPPRARATGSWPPACPARSASRTPPTAP